MDKTENIEEYKIRFLGCFGTRRKSLIGERHLKGEACGWARCWASFAMGFNQVEVFHV